MCLECQCDEEAGRPGRSSRGGSTSAQLGSVSLRGTGTVTRGRLLRNRLLSQFDFCARNESEEAEMVYFTKKNVLRVGIYPKHS